MIFRLAYIERCPSKARFFTMRICSLAIYIFAFPSYVFGNDKGKEKVIDTGYPDFVDVPEVIWTVMAKTSHAACRRWADIIQSLNPGLCTMRGKYFDNAVFSLDAEECTDQTRCAAYFTCVVTKPYLGCPMAVLRKGFAARPWWTFYCDPGLQAVIKSAGSHAAWADCLNAEQMRNRLAGLSAAAASRERKAVQLRASIDAERARQEHNEEINRSYRNVIARQVALARLAEQHPTEDMISGVLSSLLGYKSVTCVDVLNAAESDKEPEL